jgi:hypothetical protein
MSQFDLLIDCHGSGAGTPATFICRHLANGSGRGFHLQPDEEDPWPDAWCDECEHRLAQDGGWSEGAFLESMTTVCGGCWDRAREDRGGGPAQPMSLSDVDALVADSLCRQQRRQDEMVRAFRVGRHGRWRWEPGTGGFWFDTESGVPRLSASFLFAGTYAPCDGSFLWSWANPTLERALTKPLVQVKRFGEARGIDWLAHSHHECDEPTALRWMAVAADRLGGRFIYRVLQDPVFVYVLLKDIRWVE